MVRGLLFIVFHEGRWKIRMGGRHVAVFDTRTEAMRSAIDSATRAGRAGVATQVLVEGDDHRFQTAWCHGQYHPSSIH
jgi:hypothetical protein